GVSPGPTVSAARLRILRDDGSNRPPVRPDRPPVPIVAAQPARAPAQLPADIPLFSGRRRELSELDGLMEQAGTPSGGVTVMALSGTAGVGKTALAVHWAHRVRHAFPDGQLYVNLHGFDQAK